MTSDPGKSLPLTPQLAGLSAGFLAKVLPNRSPATKVTVCDLGRTRTVLLELEKRSDHLFIHHIDVIKNAPQDQKLSAVLKPFLDGKKFRKDGSKNT